MPFKTFLYVLLFLSSHTCIAQGAGCFAKRANSSIALETNIDYSKYNVFFVGEFHGVYGVSEVKLALIKYLNINCGINDVFMEVGYSTAWLYNKYLQTGDTTLFTEPVLTYAQKKPNRDFWKSLYAWNNTLDKKIVIHGMDFERMNFIKALKLMLPAAKDQPAEIAMMLNWIDTVTITSTNADMRDKQHPGLVLNKLYDSLRSHVAQNRGLYQEYYGQAFSDVEQIMFNENTFADYALRNKTMYHNIMKETKKEGISKFIVFSGLNHSNMSYQGWRSLCYRLVHTPAYRHRLANISMVCKNCYDWQVQPQSAFAAYRAPFTYQKDTALLSDLYLRLFNSSCLYTLVPAEAADNKKVSNFGHYLILMKDQPEF